MKYIRKHIITLLSIGLMTTLLFPQISDAAQYALVIGNSDYLDAPLQNPVNDARDIANALEALGFTVITKVNVTQQVFEDAIREFGRTLRADDVGVFYFSGHGVQVEGVNYLLPVDAKIEKEHDIKYKAVNAGLVLDEMQYAGSRVNILIFDACRNNPFKSVRSLQKGLAVMTASAGGTFIAYATAPGTVAYDDPQENNSPYTRHLLRNLAVPGVKIEDLFKQVRIAVMADTDNKQIPWDSSSLIGEFYFFPQLQPTITPTSPSMTSTPSVPLIPTTLPSPTPIPEPTAAPTPTPTVTPTPEPDASIEQNIELFREVIQLIQTNYAEESKVQISDLLGVAIMALETAVRKAPRSSEKEIDMFKVKGLKADDVDDFAEALRLALPHSRLSSQELVYASIHGILKHLDEHSSFMPPDVYHEMQVDTRGNFSGVGMQIGIRDEQLIVIAPIDETPAVRAGIQAGDKILKIGERSTDNMTLMEAVKLLRGPQGTPVTITIMRDAFEHPREFTITRDIIDVKSVTSKVVSKQIGYIRIRQFQENASDDLAKALKDLKKQKIKTLIVDLRSNPGGLLNSAVEVADQFLQKGKLIVYTDGRKSNQDMRFNTHTNSADLQYPILLLVDQGSASASEIVAGALQAHSRAIIVGTPTYGKGSMQSVIPISDGSGLRLTTAYYFTPDDKPIDRQGITPDVLVIPKDKQELIRTAEILRNVKNTPLILVEPHTEGGTGEEDHVLAIAIQLIENTSSYKWENVLKTAEKMMK